MIFQQLLRVCIARARLIAIVALSVLTTALLISIWTPYRYTATTAMVIDFPSNDLVAGGSVYMPGTIANFLATQLDILRSERVISRAIETMKLEDQAKIQNIWLQKTQGRGTIREWLLAQISKNLRAEASREGASLSLSFEFSDPVLAAEIANGISAAFISTSLEIKSDIAKGYATQFESQTKQIRQALADAQTKLSAFQQKTGITAHDERFDVENTRLQELSTQLVQIQSQASASRSRSDAAQRHGREYLPEVVANPLINTLKGDISRVEQRLEFEATRFGANHPQFIATRSELAALRLRLNTEISRIANSLSTHNTVNDQQTGLIQAALNAQRDKVLGLKKQRDQLAVLQRDVDTHQRALDLVHQRLTQATLETQARQSNISIVSTAHPPERPSHPQPLLNTIVGSFFGLILGLVAAITMESINRPLRSADDLLGSVPFPVLAVLPPAHSKRPQRLIGHASASVSPSLPLSGR